MTIFDLQGEVASATGPRKTNGDYQPMGHEMGGKWEQQPPPGKKAGAIASKKSGKDKNKGKKEKDKYELCCHNYYVMADVQVFWCLLISIEAGV